MMLKKLMLGCVVTAIGAGCGKHETSAPHADVSLDVRGENTREIAAADFVDGWSVRYSRFWLAPTFGVDETFDNRKNDGYEPIVGWEAYVWGGEELELSKPGVTDGAYYSSTVAGRSTGWGMRLRQVPAGLDHSSTGASLEVAGTATGPDAELVHFAWRFTSELMFSHCVLAGRSFLLLPEGGTLEVHVVLDGKALFASELTAEAELRFEALARADADGDGTVTTAELQATALEGTPGAKTLHELLSTRLASLVSSEYRCEVEVLRAESATESTQK
jgi:hypothetical protein